MTQHLEILNKGVPYWNEWKKYNLDVAPNLSEANLQYTNIQKADLRYTNLTKANLSHANLREATLYEANLREATLYEADLYEADLIRTNLRDANLKGANLEGANLYKANLYRADLTDAILPTDNMNVLQGDGVRIKTIRTETYRINIYDNRIQIGCKNYTIDEWFAFTDEEISALDKDALEFWREWKPKLQKKYDQGRIDNGYFDYINSNRSSTWGEYPNKMLWF